MNKADKKKQQILMHLSILPLASGKQLETLFREYKQPEKRMSMCLKELENEGLVEGKLRPIGESKIWRLTIKGREMMDVKRSLIPFNNRNVEHFLAISSAYFSLQVSSSLHYFEVEGRFPFILPSGETRVYCPDIFMVWEGLPYFVEVQRTAISIKKWKEKWEMAESFYEHHLPFQYKEYSLTKKMVIVVLSEQTPFAVRQTHLPVCIHKRIEEAFEIVADEHFHADVPKILSQLKEDIDTSRYIYQNWQTQQSASLIPPLSVEALTRYEKLLNQKV